MPKQTDTCPPHWFVIETANGGPSKGVCRKCKAEKLFQNYVDNGKGPGWAGTDMGKVEAARKNRQDGDAAAAPTGNRKFSAK